MSDKRDLRITNGVTYWGYTGNRETLRKVNVQEVRNSGSKYVNWTTIKKSGEKGSSSWSRLEKFQEWAKGVYESGGDTP